MTNDSRRDAGAAGQPDAVGAPDDMQESGLGHDLKNVDLEQAQQVGADPPGGLGLDIGGGSEGLGASVDQDDQQA